MEALTAETRSASNIAKTILSNPPIASLIAGALVAGLGIDMPRGINVYLGFVGAVAAPCALFSLGVVLSQTRVSDRISTSAAISAFKLVGLPIVAWLILSNAFGFSAAEAKFPMMVAAAPCGAMAFVLALNYRVRVDAISTAILFTMLGSVFSVAIMASL
jgi:predicted permease